MGIWFELPAICFLAGVFSGLGISLDASLVYLLIATAAVQLLYLLLTGDLLADRPRSGGRGLGT